MPRKQVLTVKDEPEDSFDFSEVFSILPSTLSSSDGSDTERNPNDVKNLIPPQWCMDAILEKENPNSNPEVERKPFNREEVLKKLLPKERQLAPEVIARYHELQEQEKIRHEQFIAKVLQQNPVEKEYNPKKARKYAKNSSDNQSSDEESKRRTTARKINNNKSIESRHKKKVERTTDILTVIHLRERILEYHMRMELMKEMLSAAKSSGTSAKKQPKNGPSSSRRT